MIIEGEVGVTVGDVAEWVGVVVVEADIMAKEGLIVAVELTFVTSLNKILSKRIAERSAYCKQKF